MSRQQSVEQRLAKVERELAILKSQIDAYSRRQNWIDAISGSFKDDPEFEEIVRLGKEIRDADRPGTQQG